MTLNRTDAALLALLRKAWQEQEDMILEFPDMKSAKAFRVSMYNLLKKKLPEIQDQEIQTAKAGLRFVVPNGEARIIITATPHRSVIDDLVEKGIITPELIEQELLRAKQVKEEADEVHKEANEFLASLGFSSENGQKKE